MLCPCSLFRRSLQRDTLVAASFTRHSVVLRLVSSISRDVQKSAAEQFIFTADASQPVEDVIRLCVGLRNLYYRLQKLCKITEEELGKRAPSALQS